MVAAAVSARMCLIPEAMLAQAFVCLARIVGRESEVCTRCFTKGPTTAGTSTFLYAASRLPTDE